MFSRALRKLAAVLLAASLIPAGEVPRSILSSHICLAPRSFSEEAPQKRLKWQRALSMLRLARDHSLILGQKVCGKVEEFPDGFKVGRVVADSLDAKQHPDLFYFEESTFSERLTFLYTFLPTGLDHLIQILEEALRQDEAPKTVRIPYLCGSGIQLRRFNRLWEPALRQGMIQKVVLAPYGRSTASLSERDVLNYDQKGDQAFVFEGPEAHAIASFILPKNWEEASLLTHIKRGLKSAARWNASDQIQYIDLNLLDDCSVVNKDYDELDPRIYLNDTPHHRYMAAVVGMEIDLERLVDFLGNKDLARQSIFRVITRLQDAFTQERRYRWVPSGKPEPVVVWVGKEEVEMSSLIKEFPAEVLSEPLVVSRLLQLLSYPPPRITSVELRYGKGKEKGETFLPVYDEDIRDNIWEALARHNPGWFEQSLEFLVAPVKDKRVGELDLFEEEVEFLFRSGWIDKATHDALINQPALRKELAPKVLEQLRQRRPYVSPDFPLRDFYARVKQRAFFDLEHSQNLVARYIRQLKADEFARDAAQKRYDSWISVLPSLVFRQHFLRLAYALFDDNRYTSIRQLSIVQSLYQFVVHNKDGLVLPRLTAEQIAHRLLWVAHYLKEVFISVEEAKSFWPDFKKQFAREFEHIQKKPAADADFYSFAQHVKPALGRFEEMLQGSGIPELNQHPLSINRHYRPFVYLAQHIADVEESL